MWGFLKSTQSWSDISDKYKDLAEQYKGFGSDLIKVKEDL